MAQGSGTITALNGTVSAQTEGFSTVVLSITGTWSATLVIEATCDDANWFSVQGINPSTTNIFSAFIQNIQFFVLCGGFSQVRIRASAFTSGTVAVAFDLSSGTNSIATIIETAVSSTAPSYSAGSLAQLSLDTNGNLRVVEYAANLTVTATGTAGSAVTLTIPSVASQFHYITAIEIVAYTTAARTGGTTPVLVTSTNLPGSNVWDFQSAGAVGTNERQFSSFVAPLKSSVSGTATTIVCPATTSVLWRINAYYYAAP